MMTATSHRAAAIASAPVMIVARMNVVGVLVLALEPAGGPQREATFTATAE